MNKHPSNSKNPTIGITSAISATTCMCEANFEYARAILLAGGTPFFIPPLSDSDTYVNSILDAVDGILLSGGDDISPEFYDGGHQTNDSLVHKVDVRRDRFEIKLARSAFQRDSPTFGICRGLQVMNVALGGSLYHDIEQAFDTASHLQKKPYESTSHEAEVEPYSLLASLTKAASNISNPSSISVKVNSMHHQAIQNIAPYLTACAFCGTIIEAAEATSKSFFLGVQWHPEYLPQFAILFDAFIASARVKM